MSTAAAPSIPALNSTHDTAALAAVYAARRRVHIPSLLTEHAAGDVHRCLAEKTPYSLVVNSGEKVFDLPSAEQAKMSPAERKRLIDAAGAGARSGFQFLYDNHRMTEAGEAYKDPAHPLASIVAFLNGEPFLSFVRTITGERDIAFADAQATRYGPGHFLTTHNDDIAGKNRLAAYVLNMTPEWAADWGGLLLFLDEQGNVTEGFTPAFNALNILAVPQPHLVSQVASFAGAHRFSITGWFRSR